MIPLRSLVWVCLLLSVCSCYGWAQESGAILGIVQLKGKGIAEHRIMLLQFGAGPGPNRIPGQTDADGRFSFEGLKTGAELSYVVGIRYEGVLYRSGNIILKANEIHDNVVVKVGSSGRKAIEGDGLAMLGEVHIGHQIIAVVWRDDHLEVREIVGIRHPGKEAYLGPSGSHGVSSSVLHLPLPTGYYNLQNVQGLELNHLRSDSRGLFYTAPLEPGNYQVVYTYSLPRPTSVATILTHRTLPLVMLDLFVETKNLVASSDLRAMGQVRIESHLFLHFRGSNLAAQSRNWFQITLVDESVSAATRILGYGLIIGLTLFGILMPVYSVVWSKRQIESGTAEPVQAVRLQVWQSEYEQLVQQIARLDDSREEGTLDAMAYREQRRMAKYRLMEVAQQLRTDDGTGSILNVSAQKESG